MTVCISVKVHDCLVFAADSASSIFAHTANGSGIIKVFRHGNKVFNLHKGLPLVAMTCGMGNFGSASIATLTKDLRKCFGDKDSEYFVDVANYSIEDIAKKARKFLFEEKYSALPNKPQGDHSFEFWIGGYGSNSSKSEVWKVQIVNGASSDAAKIRSEDECGINAAGQPEAFNRLVLGYSAQIKDALISVGVEPAKLPQVLQAIQAKTQANMLYESMPVQDAINLADFLVETTKGFVSFVPGADVVGGATDIAVVTKHEGFKWIKRKHYYNREQNPLETDHA
jgi:hypothetical protein